MPTQMEGKQSGKQIANNESMLHLASQRIDKIIFS
jgi:hypothetical protein